MSSEFASSIEFGRAFVGTEAAELVTGLLLSSVFASSSAWLGTCCLKHLTEQLNQVDISIRTRSLNKVWDCILS